MIELVQAIKDAKIAQSQFAMQSLAERFEKLRKVFPQIIEAKEDFDIMPTGLMAVILPKMLAYEALLERLIPSLQAGNSVVIKLPSGVETPWLNELKQKIDAAELPKGLVHFASGKGSEVGAFLCSHPAVNAVSAVGKVETIEQILKIPGFAKKKFQLASGGNNSLIILEDEITDKQADLVIKACYAEGGRSPWNIKKIFIKDSAKEKIIEKLIEKAKSMDPINNDENLLSQIKLEGGKILIGDKQKVALVMDLSHCSVLQQDPIDAPIALISPVKYLHEAVKWANTGYLGLACMVIGDIEKAQKLAAKLECGHVWINTWKSNEDGVITGVKQSFIGNPDFSYFGDFYSNRKKIVTSTSK